MKDFACLHSRRRYVHDADDAIGVVLDDQPKRAGGIDGNGNNDVSIQGFDRSKGDKVERSFTCCAYRLELCLNVGFVSKHIVVLVISCTSIDLVDFHWPGRLPTCSC